MSERVEKMIQLRSQAIGFYLQGLSERAITDQLDCSRSLVRNAIAKFRAGVSLKDAARSGRPPKLSKQQVRAVVRNLNQNRAQTGTDEQDFWYKF